MNRFFLLATLCVPLWATVSVKDFGAHGDGVTDDTAALNLAFRTACAASDELHIPSGTYLTDSLKPLSGCDILLYGDGSEQSILKSRSATGPNLLSFSKGKTITIQALTLDGGHLSAAGLAIEQYRSVIINRVYVHDFGVPGYSKGHRRDYDGFYIRNIEDVQISDSISTGNERTGIELQAVHNSMVSNSVMNGNGGMGGVSEQNFDGPLDGPLLAQWFNNTLENNGSGGIDVETDPTLAPAHGVLKGNQVINCGNDNWKSGWALVIGLHSFGSIDGNRVEHFAADAPPSDYANAIVYGRNEGPISIINNTVVGTKSSAILGDHGSFAVTIRGNTLTHNKTGIFIYKSPDIQIVENTITDSSGPGIAIYWSNHSRVAHNRFAGNRPNVLMNGHNSSQQ